MLFRSDGALLLKRIRSAKLSRRFDLDSSYPYTRLLERQAKGQVDSWAIRWYATNFLLGRMGLYPSKSLLENIGFDGTGVHCGAPDSKGALFNGELVRDYEPLRRITIRVDEDILKATGRALNRMLPPPLWIRGLWKIRRFLKAARRGGITPE